MMAEPLRLCPSGHPADEPHTNDLDDSWICCCDDPTCCWRYDGNELSRDEAIKGWNHRVPGPATHAVLEKIAATAEMFKTERRGSGFGANISFTLDEMRDLLAEWAEPTPPSAPDQPTPSSPWTCCICGAPVRITDELQPWHLDGPTNHDAELSDADRKTLADGLRLTD